MTKEFSLKIELENEAFDACNGDEVARILHRIAANIAQVHYRDDDGGTIRDINGNTVGRYDFTGMED